MKRFPRFRRLCAVSGLQINRYILIIRCQDLLMKHLIIGVSLLSRRNKKFTTPSSNRYNYFLFSPKNRTVISVISVISVMFFFFFSLNLTFFLCCQNSHNKFSKRSRIGNLRNNFPPTKMPKQIVSELTF